ncbi:MAG: type II secretion system protein [Dehalococcoidia bacterium]|nr:type II secretion system protein [Dehalococcoidia bacterium]
MRRPVKLWLRVHKGQKGFTLIETLVGVAIFAAIGVALMSGLITGYKSEAISQEKVYAEGLAKSQVEYIWAQDYISVANYDPNDPAKRYAIIDIPAYLAGVGYSVEINAPETVDVPGVSGYELQGVTIKVNYQGATKLAIMFYRAGLAL